MNPRWHIAFCNVTITEYAGLAYRDYYDSPARMLEAQLKASDMMERRFGVGRFIRPYIDSPPVLVSSFLGMPVLVPEEDELPYLDSRCPLLQDAAEVGKLSLGDPKTDGLMAKRWEAWQYYRAHGYDSRFYAGGGGVATVACEISANNVLWWLNEDPENAGRLFDFVVDAYEALYAFDDGVREPNTSGYTADDFAGLLSPEMFRKFVVPRYQRLYEGMETRHMHSELLRAEHLRIARDLVGITSFHGAGAENLTIEEMRAVMGNDFWVQLIPQDLEKLSPAAIDEQIKEFANCGAAYVQIYPGRGVPDRNMEAAVNALQRECSGGPCWDGKHQPVGSRVLSTSI